MSTDFFVDYNIIDTSNVINIHMFGIINNHAKCMSLSNGKCKIQPTLLIYS